MDRVILHCDLNNFFASVACLLQPELRGQPVAVCGSPELRKGIVLAKSIPAKQQGVKTGMVIWQAQQLCPNLKIVATDYPSYAHYSQKVREIYYRFTNQVESFGIDECWLDVTGSQKLFGDGVTIANRIRETVKHELGLTISVGVSFNKTYAKLASDLAAPDSVAEINLTNYQQLVYPLPINNLLFVGKKTHQLFTKLNLQTIGDLAHCDPQLLSEFLGINAQKLIMAARGEDRSPVADFLDAPVPKSVGNGTTLPYDLRTRKEVLQVIYLLTEKVAYRLRKHGLAGTTINLSVKGSNLHWVGAQESLSYATNTVPPITQVATQIFDKIWAHGAAEITPVRALRVAVAHLTTAQQTQLDCLLDDDSETKNRTLAAVFDKVRQKYGTTQIMFGGTAQSYAKLGFDLDFYECDERD